MRIQYLAYPLVVLSFVQGFFSFHPLFVIPLALVTSLLFSKSRRQAVREDKSPLKPSPIIDGLYLFVLHLLIHFFAFAMGYFINYSGEFSA